MSNPPPQPRAPSVNLVDAIAKSARAFFKFVFATMQAYDELPIGMKYSLKESLVSMMAQSPRGKDFEYFLRDDKELARILEERGWWVLQRDITGPIQRDILRFAREGKGDEIDTYLYQLFAKDDYAALKGKVRNWFATPYLSQRESIVLDCLWAHRQRKYNLTVPCLLPLVDGLTRDFCRTLEAMGLTSEKRGTIKAGTFAAVYKNTEESLWGNPFNKIINEFVFESFTFSKETPRASLNRHGILHGEIPSYGTEANSLKLFLMIDTIQSFIQTFNPQTTQSRTVSSANVPQLPPRGVKLGEGKAAKMKSVSARTGKKGKGRRDRRSLGISR